MEKAKEILNNLLSKRISIGLTEFENKHTKDFDDLNTIKNSLDSFQAQIAEITSLSSTISNNESKSSTIRNVSTNHSSNTTTETDDNNILTTEVPRVRTLKSYKTVANMFPTNTTENKRKDKSMIKKSQLIVINEEQTRSKYFNKYYLSLLLYI